MTAELYGQLPPDVLSGLNAFMLEEDLARQRAGEETEPAETLADPAAGR
jgi:hypothetical protein